MPTQRDVKREIARLKKPDGMDVGELPILTIHELLRLADPDAALDTVGQHPDAGFVALSDGSYRRMWEPREEPQP